MTNSLVFQSFLRWKKRSNCGSTEVGERPGNTSVRLTIDDLNTLSSLGPRELADMGLDCPFDAHKPGHLTALRAATRSRIERQSQDNYNDHNKRAAARKGQ